MKFKIGDNIHCVGSIAEIYKIDSVTNTDYLGHVIHPYTSDHGSRYWSTEYANLFYCIVPDILLKLLL